MNHSDVAHEALVVGLSYVFILAGSWNDHLLGLTVTPFSRFLEAFTALAVALEIVSRLAFARSRTPIFWAVLALDVVSLLTVFPELRFFALARGARGVYASVRLVALLDRMARRAKQAAYLILVFPLVVPLMAAVVYALDHNAPGSPVRSYPGALSICFSFALSLGQIRPVTPGAMAVCGTLFLSGLLCLGILSNSISLRYAESRS